MEPIDGKLKKLIDLITQCKFQEALDEYYDENVLTYENEGAPTEGLAAYKEAGEKFQSSISDYSAKLEASLISGDISVCQWYYRFHHADWGDWDKTQVSIQRWRNGKIVYERHYY